MDLDEKKSVELSQREMYYIIHALPGFIHHLDLQDISNKQKKYTKDIEDMKKLKKRFEDEFSSRLK